MMNTVIKLTLRWIPPQIGIIIICDIQFVRIFGRTIYCYPIGQNQPVFKTFTPEISKRIKLRQSKHLNALVITLYDKYQIIDDGNAVGTLKPALFTATIAKPLNIRAIGGIIDNNGISFFSCGKQPVLPVRAVPDSRAVNIVAFIPVGMEPLF